MGRSNAASQCSRNNSNGSSLYQQRDGNPCSSRSHSQQSLQRRAPTARMIAEQMTNSNALVHGGAPPPMGTKKRAPSVMPTSRQPPAKKVRKSQTEFPLMERGLLPYNHGPDLGVDARLQVVDSNEDQVPMTRTILRRRSKSLNDEPLSPRQSLNVTHLMRAQIEPDPHGFGEQSMNLERPRNVGQNRHRVPRLVPLSLEKPLSEQVVKFPLKEAWRSWENEKGGMTSSVTRRIPCVVI